MKKKILIIAIALALVIALGVGVYAVTNRSTDSPDLPETEGTTAAATEADPVPTETTTTPDPAPEESSVPDTTAEPTPDPVEEVVLNTEFLEAMDLSYAELVAKYGKVVNAAIGGHNAVYYYFEKIPDISFCWAADASGVDRKTVEKPFDEAGNLICDLPDDTAYCYSIGGTIKHLISGEWDTMSVEDTVEKIGFKYYVTFESEDIHTNELQHYVTLFEYNGRALKVIHYEENFINFDTSRWSVIKNVSILEHYGYQK